MTYQKLKATARKLIYMEHEHDFLPVVLATVIANRLDAHPVWLMVIAGPSSGKTMLINALSKCDEGIMISMLTPKTLISGAKDRDTVDGKEASLMARLDGRIMLIKDASTITEMSANTRSEVFSQLRTAFDGSLEKDTGLGRKEFKAKFGIILAGTSSLEKVRTFESELGERFVNFRPIPEEDSRVKLFMKGVIGRKRQLEEDLSIAMHEYLSTCGVPAQIDIPDPLWDHAQLLVKLRAGVSRDAYKRFVNHPVDDGMESPYRVGEQLATLYSCLLHVLHNEHTALSITKRVALDSVPYVRMRFMQCLQSGIHYQADIVKSMKMGTKAVAELADSMALLGITDVSLSANAKKIVLQPHYKQLFNLCTRV